MRIYDTLVITKEISESLIKAMLELEIYLSQLVETSINKTLYFNKIIRVTFSNEDL